MGRFLNRVGMTYGYLTVLERVQNQRSKTNWKCKCICGNNCYKRSDQLNNISMCSECDSLYRKGCILSPLGKLHPNIKDLTGNKYGKLIVIEIDKEESLKKRGVVWKCKCECGNYKSVPSHSLINGLVTSCGCNHFKEIKPGTRFGKIVVLKRIENSNAGKAKYLCRCDCGTLCKIVGNDLRSGQQLSCGCIKSKGEYKIIQLLNDNNIQYIKEAKFDDCKDENELPFDFQIFADEKFYLLEYDGKQHQDLKHAWNNFSYEKTKKHDDIKNQWCKEKNIPLIRIPYTNLNNLCLEDLLLKTSKYIIN